MHWYYLPRRRLLKPLYTNTLLLRWRLCSRKPGQGYSTAAPAAFSTSSAPRNSRWLSDTQKRLGACIKFGLRSDTDVAAAQRISQALGTSWKGLVAGAEGFPVDSLDPELPSPIWSQKVLWGEMDSMGHVNNARYLRYAETSRIWYFRRLLGLVPAEHKHEWNNILNPSGIGVILKTIKIDYLLPLQFPDTISLIHSLGAPATGDPPSEINLRCVVLSHNHQRIAARIEENVPYYDYQKARKVPLPPWVRNLFARSRQHEESSREQWLSTRANIDGWLMGLEESTTNSGKPELIGGNLPLNTKGPAEPRAPASLGSVDRMAKQPLVATDAKGVVNEEQDHASARPRVRTASAPTWGVKP